MGAAILGGFLGAITQILGFFVMLAGIITSFFVQLAVSALNAVTGSTFITLSYTNPANNAFIATGWELTRGLTNIIFVLVLLAIGLGTALKINEYQWQKTLPLLIGIALLINFTPVILGVIVDASNIVMNYFLSSGFQGGSILGDQLKASISTWTSGFGDFWNPASHMNTFAALLVIVFFNIIAAFIFFIFAAIFLMRYVTIWLLVILSPIAFACYILPKTRSYFTKWWSQFLQWTFVGVTASFFLYLANQIMKLVLVDKSVVFASQGVEGLGLLNSILPWGIVIIFLFLGLQASMSSGAQGANLAINALKKTPKALAGTRLGKKVLGGMAFGTQRGLAGTPEFLKGRLGKIPIVGKGLGWAARPLGWMAQGANRIVGPKLIEYAARVGKVDLPPGFDNWTGPQQEAWVKARNLDQNDTLRVGSKMGANLEYTKDDFQTKVQNSAASALKKQDPAYQEEAKAIAKVFPQIITEEVREAMKTFGKKGIVDRQEALSNARDDIENTVKFIRSNLNLTDDNSAIDAGLKLKYITQEDVTTNRAKALETVNKKIRGEAAVATYVRDFKAGDIGKIANTKTLGTRTGFILGNPNNFQKIVDEHGVSALKDAVEGAGGLNDTTNTPAKLDRLFDTNRNARAFFTNPALSQIDFAGRSQMLDPNDQPTIDPNALIRRAGIRQIIERHSLSNRVILKGALDASKKIKVLEEKTRQVIKENPELGEREISVPELKNLKKKREELRATMMTEAGAGHHKEATQLSGQIKAIDKKRREAGERMRQLKDKIESTPALKKMRDEIKNSEDEIKSAREEFERVKKTTIDPSIELKSSWDQMEKLRTAKTRGRDLFL